MNPWMTTQSSSKDDDFVIPTISMPEFDATKQLIVYIINRNNMFITRYFNQLNIECPRCEYTMTVVSQTISNISLFLRIVNAVKKRDNYFAQ